VIERVRRAEICNPLRPAFNIFCTSCKEGINETDTACSTCRGEERYVQDFGRGTLRQRNRLEELGVDGTIILKRILNK
jgi:hypothetical protein